jgi:hypothetical protein
MSKFLKCVFAVLVGLLATAGNVITLVGGIVIIIPTAILTVVMKLSKMAKDAIEKALQVEYPWWLPFDPDYLLKKMGEFLSGTIKGFGEIWKWVKSVC